MADYDSPIARKKAILAEAMGSNFFDEDEDAGSVKS
jgi:hypothetical protein